jgi:hypothetical protein
MKMPRRVVGKTIRVTRLSGPREMGLLLLAHVLLRRLDEQARREHGPKELSLLARPWFRRALQASPALGCARLVSATRKLMEKERPAMPSHQRRRLITAWRARRFLREVRR